MRILDTHAPLGSEVLLKKFAPTKQKIKAGSPRAEFLAACPDQVTRGELLAIYTRHKKQAKGLLSLDKFLAASKWQCFLATTPAAFADYARLKSAIATGDSPPLQAEDSAGRPSTSSTVSLIEGGL